MDNLTNIKDFQNFFLNESVEINFYNFIIALILSAFLSFLIKRVYLYSSQSLSNKNYFSDLFIPLGIITCLVITVIKFSLALSLGLVGALSIVRFRAAIKEPEELIYLFLIIGIGLACGANQFLVAIFATILISIVLVLLSLIRRKNRKVGNKIDSNIIQIEILNREIKIEEVTNLIKKHSVYLKLKSSNLDEKKETYLFSVEFKNKSNFFKINQTLKKYSDKNVNIAFYSNDNIFE